MYSFIQKMRKWKVFDFFFTLYEKYKEVIRYLIFGVLTTLVNIVSYFIMARLFNMNYMLATILALILSILFAYITNRLYVFESKSKNILKEMISFFSFRILSSLIDIFDMYLFVQVFKIDDMIVKIGSNILVIILNYIFSKLFVFKTKE